MHLIGYFYCYYSIPTTLGPEGVQYAEKFGILKVILNDALFTSL